MPHISVSITGISMAVITQFMWALVWYGIFFRRHWSRAMGINPDSRPVRRRLIGSMSITLLGSCLMAWVLALNIAAWDPVSWGIQQENHASLPLVARAAFLSWGGFIVPILLSGVAWGRKSLALFAINSCYYLVGILVMAASLIYF